jgi:hypothetical protein
MRNEYFMGWYIGLKLYSRIIPVAKHSIQAKKYDINHAHLAESNVSFCHHLASVNFSHFNLLL